SAARHGGGPRRVRRRARGDARGPTRARGAPSGARDPDRLPRRCDRRRFAVIEVKLSPEQLDELAERVAEKLAARASTMKAPAAMLSPRTAAELLGVTPR